MKVKSGFLVIALVGSLAATQAWSQSSSEQTTTNDQKRVEGKKGRSAGGEIGSGSGDVAKGAAKGAGSAAKGVGEGAGDLVTLHPVGAATAVGKGGANAGKDVAVGTTKGTGKILKGIGKGIKHIF